MLFKYVSLLPLALVPVAAYYREWHALSPVLLTSAVFAGFGYALSRIPTRRDPRLQEGMLVAALGWLVVPLGCMLPFLLIEGWWFLDAYFETMSAWTGTGMTMADVTALSHTTLAWRSLMQWIGGLGVIILTLSILARPGTAAHTLYASEGREDKLRPSVVSTVRAIWWIYALYTVGAIALLLAVGLPPWHALNHGLTGIATGGMSILPGSIGDYNDPKVEAALVVIMLAGSIAFVAHYSLLKGRWRAFLTDEQLKTMAVVLTVAVVWLFLALRAQSTPEVPAWREAVFQGVSAVTTTGFQTARPSTWSADAKIGLSAFMLLGGAAGSTAGGIKLVRGSLLFRGALWKIERAGLPHFAVTRFRFGGQNLDEKSANEEFSEAAFIAFLWMVMFFVGLVTLVATVGGRAPVVDLFFDVASAAGNNGIATGVIGPALPAAAKAAVIALMWAARLEIIPVLLLVRLLLPGTRKR